MRGSLEMDLRRLKMLGGLLVHAAYATEGVMDREDFGITGALIQQEAEKALETLEGSERYEPIPQGAKR